MSSLAAARADNFYFPPDWDPSKGNKSKGSLRKQHPLRERAKKIDQGILVIRFELPFNVWCGGCKKMIAKGRRFNAEKKAVGQYHSTKIWSFKCITACCGHTMEIHTDPKGCDYVIVSGAERKVEEFDAADAETGVLDDRAELERATADPMAKLEHGKTLTARAAAAKEPLEALRALVDARHRDPYTQNKALRRALRTQRREEAVTKAHAAALGLPTHIPLLPPAEEDAVAAHAAFADVAFDRDRDRKRAAITGGSIFGVGGGSARAGAARAGQRSIAGMAERLAKRQRA